MGLFGGDNIGTLAKKADIPGLWKALAKKGSTRMATTLVDSLGPSSGADADALISQLWDWAVHLSVQKKQSLEVLCFAGELCKSGRAYAGTGPLTPAEYLNRWATGPHGAHEQGYCPGCDQLLTQVSKGELQPREELGMYRVCKACGRHYHRACAAGAGACKCCGGGDWMWSLRSVRRQ